jgi:hypothetical protein
MSWQIWAAIGAAAANHVGTQMTARNQRAPAYAGDVSLQGVQTDNLNANYANLPEFEMLTSGINRQNQADKLKSLEMAMPGYSEWSKGMSETAGGYAQGELTQGQTGSIVRKNAESAWGGGLRGQAGDYSLLNKYGRAQMSNVSRSQQMMAALNNLSSVDITGVQDMYTTMDDALGTALANRSAKQAWLNADQAAKNIRKNAPWSALAQSGTSYAEWKSGKQSSSASNMHYGFNDVSQS